MKSLLFSLIGELMILPNRSYIWEAIKQHPRTVALIITSMITLPLFAFTSLPPVEVTEEILQNTVEEILIPIEVPVNVSVEVPIEINQTIEMEVNKTVEVEVNITKEVVVNTTIGVNITEGGSIFLESQPLPPLIDMDIVFCIDTSGSMDANRMPLAKAAIRNTLNLINQSYWANLSNDQVSLVSFDYINDGDWTTDATLHAPLDYISNQTHLSHLLSEVESLSGLGGTDAWAGLNLSLDALFNTQRNSSVLKTILFLTDGKHNSGPWGTEVNAGNYDGFMQLPSNRAPASASPIVVARNNNVKIYSIGLFEGAIYDFDELFLRNISLDENYGTAGDFFVGNDTLSLSEGFLTARDHASGWVTVNSSEVVLQDTGTFQMFTYNVTNDIRRLKWDLNWIDSSVDFNLTIIDPNKTCIDISTNITKNIIPITLKKPKSIIFDFPILGFWQFNLSWQNITSPGDLIKGRLSSYNPPIFIESITQYNSSTFNTTLESFPLRSILMTSNTTQPFLDSISFRVTDFNDSVFSNQSVYFLVNVTNKNPWFTYNNITPYVLANFSSFNISHTWDPPVVNTLTTNESISFLFNLTFLEPTLLQGDIFFKVNCSEGYYDAVAQSVTLDYRITTQNVTVESHLENQTITVVENRTISVVENQTIITVISSTGYELRTQITLVPGTTNVLKYTYDRQMFDTLKWIGFFATLALLMSFLVVYIMSQAHHLKNLANKFRGRFFQDQSALELALQREGITIAPADLSSVMMEADDLDQLGDNIFNLTGKRLSPEELIRLASGTNMDKIADRISYVTGMSKDEIISHLRDAPSIEVLIERLNLDSERFLDIIARDEDVINFQKRIFNLMPPTKREISGIRIYDDLNVDQFRSRLREKFYS
ncbi:MAG: VWA domain-containing protein [Promethearchaeota archaeon]